MLDLFMDKARKLLGSDNPAPRKTPVAKNDWRGKGIHRTKTGPGRYRKGGAFGNSLRKLERGFFEARKL